MWNAHAPWIGQARSGGGRGGAGGSSFGPAGATFASTGSAAQVQITPFVSTTTTVTSLPASTTFGESVTFTATIGYPATATGTVQFYDGASPLGSPQAVDAANQATFTTSTLTAGPHTITAVYSGDTGAEGSTSADLPYTVSSPPTASATSTATATATATATDTATATATVTNTPPATPVPQGGACTIASQCSTLNCADGVCCDTACDAPLEQCNLPGQVGTCATTAAGAPAASTTGLLVMLGVLLGAAFVALRLRRA